jgi:hypothetical protein
MRKKFFQIFYKCQEEIFLNFTNLAGIFLIENKYHRSLRGSPASGPLRGTAGQEGFSKLFPVIDRRRGRPAGSGE